ncbi:MAG: hypothetical protein ACRD4W_13825, partial [Nitrososphaeraceae archaeon]
LEYSISQGKYAITMSHKTDLFMSDVLSRSTLSQDESTSRRKRMTTALQISFFYHLSLRITLPHLSR